VPSWDHTFENWLWREQALEPVGDTAHPTIVFDLDGVLSDASTRQHFIEYPRRDWEAFFQACGDDELIDEVARLLEVLDPEHRIVLLTARPIRVQPQTLAWLQRYGLRWDLLIMRDFGDYSAARTFKLRTTHELRSRGFELRLAFEDDPRNVDMFHSQGVPCVYIHSGYYE
jgi:phosphoglycolate phosphatase-like HAD superfamily hydrolase